MRIVAIVALAIAGLVHIIISPSHYNHAPAHGIFFFLTGIAELAWIFFFWRWPSRISYYAGLALSGGMVVLWVLTLIYGAPFGEGAEPLDAGAISSKLAELIGFAALIWLGLRGHLPTFSLNKMPRLLAEAVILALVIGFGSYGVGYAVEPLMPGLQHVGDDHHEGDDAHTESDHHEGEDSHEGDDDHMTSDHQGDDDSHQNDPDGGPEKSDADHANTEDASNEHQDNADDHPKNDGNAHTGEDSHDDSDGHHDDNQKNDADHHDNDDGHHDGDASNMTKK